MNAGRSPSELIVSMGLESVPSSPIVKDCRPPIGETSLTALQKPN